jgi:hypothetical protein
MTLLDCYDVDSTLASFTATVGAGADEITSALIDYDESRFDGSEEPYKRMPREVLALFGTDPDTVSDLLAGAYYFHGTRAIDPESFRALGILPLDAVLEEIWATLRELAHECRDDAWAAFRTDVEADGGGHYGSLYRLKSRGAMHFGPHGELVREIFLNPRPSGSHDYLACPEIVQDIAWCAESALGIGLEERFCAAAKPTLVKFRAPLWSGAVPTALWSLYYMLRQGNITGRNACGGFAGCGTNVPASDVVDVEVITDR